MASAFVALSFCVLCSVAMITAMKFSEQLHSYGIS